MILLCVHCGEELTSGPCGCEREPVTSAPALRPLTQLEAVVATAAAMGGVDEHTVREAARALRGRPS